MLRKPTVVEGVLALIVAYCAVHERIEDAAPQLAVTPRKQHCCILLHGLAPRVSKWSCTASVSRISDYTLPILAKTVLRPNAENFGFDIVGHSWDDGWTNFKGCVKDYSADAPEEVQRAVQQALLTFRSPVQVHFQGTPSTPARAETAGFESLAVALRVALSLPKTFDWILALRWDTVFLRPVDLDALNPKLLYLAHMCLPQKKTRVGDVVRHEQWWQWDQCAPDFYFLGSPLNLALAFGGDFELDLRRGVFNATSCKGGHGLVAGRLNYLRHTLHVPVGRYLYHLQDVHYVRDESMANNLNGSFPARYACATDGRARWGEALPRNRTAAYDPNAAPWNNPRVPAPFSRCPPRAIFRDACDV